MTAITDVAVFELSDALGRGLGRVAVEGVQNGWLVGQFEPGPDYPQVEPVFRALAEMVESFSLHHTDEAMRAIESLGVTLQSEASRTPIRAHDVQIDSDGGFACRLHVSSVS